MIDRQRLALGGGRNWCRPYKLFNDLNS